MSTDCLEPITTTLPMERTAGGDLFEKAEFS